MFQYSPLFKSPALTLTDLTAQSKIFKLFAVYRLDYAWQTRQRGITFCVFQQPSLFFHALLEKVLLQRIQYDKSLKLCTFDNTTVVHQ
jgi:hypothetical protein